MRQPRPQGTTYLSMKYQQTKDATDKQNLYKHLITIYATSGFQWNNTPANIPKLASILNIPQSTILDLISSVGQNMGNLVSPQNIKNTLESIITLSTSFALEDRGLIMHQLKLLLEAQGDSYRPFVSGEVSKTLKLVLDSNKNISEIYKTFFTSTNNTTNILNIHNQSKEEQEDLLTADTAMELLHSGQIPNRLPATSNQANNQGKQGHQLPMPNASLSDTAQLADTLYERYGIGDFETVRENRHGSEALLPPIPDGPEAMKLNNNELGRGDKALKRRGYDVVDVDELPDS